MVMAEIAPAVMTVTTDEDMGSIMVRRWTHTLGLDDWDIRFSAEPAEDGRYAEVDWRDQEKVAQIRMAPLLGGEHLEPSVVHELLHLVFKPYTIPMERLISLMEEPMRTFLAGQMDDAEEQIIETLVRAFGFERFLPFDDLVETWTAFGKAVEDPHD